MRRFGLLKKSGTLAGMEFKICGNFFSLATCPVFKNFFADFLGYTYCRVIGGIGPLCFGMSGLLSYFLYKKVVSLHVCTVVMSSCRLPGGVLLEN